MKRDPIKALAKQLRAPKTAADKAYNRAIAQEAIGIMSTELDLDDAAATSPLALKELARLREEHSLLCVELATLRLRFGISEPVSPIPARCPHCGNGHDVGNPCNVPANNSLLAVIRAAVMDSWTGGVESCANKVYAATACLPCDDCDALASALQFYTELPDMPQEDYDIVDSPDGSSGNRRIKFGTRAREALKAYRGKP